MNDTVLREAENDSGKPRQRFILEDTGFNEVPKKYRRFYRRQSGPGDTLAATPPVGTAWVRRVRGHNLWIWFDATETRLVLFSLQRRPPVPLDPELA